MVMLPDYIKDKLKEGPEQTLVVGPLVERLIKNGWAFEQIVFGKVTVQSSPRQGAKVSIRQKAMLKKE